MFKKIFNIITFNDYKKSNPHSNNGIIETTKYLLNTTLVIMTVIALFTKDFEPLAKLMVIYVSCQILFRIIRY